MMQNHYNSDGKSFEPRILYQDKLPIKCESRIETFLYLFIYYFFGGKEPQHLWMLATRDGGGGGGYVSKGQLPAPVPLL